MATPEPVWLDRLVVDVIHQGQLREHGGLLGLREENALESALARPRHRWHYAPDTDLAGLAAAYGFALARNHAYVDGNKRVAFVAMAVFLHLNGFDAGPANPEAVFVMLDVASGVLSETELAAWLRTRIEPVR